MALLYFTGFEYGEIQAEVAASSGTIAVQATTKHTGDYALQCNPTTTGSGYAYFQKYAAGTGSSQVQANINVATLYASFDFYVGTLPASNKEIIARGSDGTNPKLYLYVGSDGYLAVHDSTDAIVATGTSAQLSEDTWYRIDFKMGTGATGAYEVRVDGTTVTGLSGTASCGTVNNNRLYLGKTADRNGNTVNFYYDNLIINDDAFADTGSVVKRMSPDGDGSYTAWTASGSGDDWQQVDELRASTDSNYLISTGSDGDASTVTLQSTTDAGIAGTILGALLRGWVIRHTGSDGSVELRVRSGGSNYDSLATATQSVNKFNGYLNLVDPATSSAWTTSGLDAIEVGAVENDTDASRLYSLHLMVAYTPGATTTPTVTSSAPTEVTTTTATGHGTVTSDGGATVTARGVCWGASADPDLDDSHAEAASGGTGAFTASITGLSAATTYHYRAYATNSEGTAYSSDATFSTDGAITLTAPDTFGILVEGTYTGSPTGIEAQFDGQGWTVIDASPSGGTFSAYLSGLTAGTGTLEVRHEDDTGVSDSVPNISVGEASLGSGGVFLTRQQGIGV